MSNGKNNYGAWIVYVTFIPLLMISTIYGFNVVNETDYQTALGVQDTLNYTVNSNWADEGTLSSNMNTDSSIIYPDQNSNANWVSFAQEFPRNRILNLTYDADMRDGTGFIEIRAWKNNLTGTPDQTSRVNLTSGTIEEKIGLEEYDVFVAEVNLTENDGSNNQRPNVDSINLEFEIVEGQKQGLEKSMAILLTLLVIFVAIFSVIFELIYRSRFE